MGRYDDDDDGLGGLLTGLGILAGIGAAAYGAYRLYKDAQQAARPQQLPHGDGFSDAQEDASRQEETKQEAHTGPDPYYYGILGIKPGVTWEEVNAAYRNMVRFWHPDNYASNEKKQEYAQEQMKLVNDAFDMLKKYYGR